MLFHAHSGLRYLVLLAGLLAVIWLLVGVFSRRGYDRPGRILVAVFVGTLDLQILLGLALFIGGTRPPTVHMHLTMMLLAAFAAHGGSVLAKKGGRLTPALAGTLLALSLIVGGILAVADSVF